MSSYLLQRVRCSAIRQALQHITPSVETTENYTLQIQVLFVDHVPESPRVPESYVHASYVPESRVPESYVSESQSYVSASPFHVPVPLLVTAVYSERILAVSPEIWQRGSSIKHTESTPKDLRGFPKRFPKKYPKQFLKRIPMHFPPENIVAISLLPTVRSSFRWKCRPEMDEMARTIRETSHWNGNFR